MSDYLWDKTGEPEADVAQLESLLGTLKYQPRPLEIPAAAMPPAIAATRPRPATIFSRPRLALAASLVLTLLAGAWLVTRQNEPRENQFAEAGLETPSSVVRQTETPAGTHDATGRQSPAGNVELSKPGGDKTVVVAASLPRVHRGARQAVAKRQKLQTRVKEQSPAPREEVATAGGASRWQVEQPLTPEQREATEQLMLALRLASAKLNYAQREMQEIGRAGK